MASNSNNNNKNGGLLGKILIGIGVIIIIFYVYSLIVSYRTFKKTSPYLINGMIDATTSMKFKAFRLPPCTSSAYGTEITYSTWLYIDDSNFSSKGSGDCTRAPKHIFHKGSYAYVPQHGNNSDEESNTDTTFTYPLLQMPGVWLYPHTNKLNIQFNTFENVSESSDVGNIPLNMWVNLIIVLIGQSVDVYINGNLKKRTKLVGVPKINYGDLYVTNWGGYQGYLSNFRYFNYAIEPFLVDQIFRLGPSYNIAPNPSLTATANLAPNYWMTVGFPNSVGQPGFNQNPQTST